jgi:putative transposase
LTIIFNMSNLRRYDPYGKPVYITNVTYNRAPILADNVDLFWQSMENTKTKHPFDLIAWAIMPEHLHLIIETGATPITKIMHDFKLSFSSYYRKRNNMISGKVWQLRFWDHIIRNQKDLNRHIDYTHYNPVKHGLTNRPLDYANTSFHKYREFYPPDWGVKDTIDFDGDFGE